MQSKQAFPPPERGRARVGGDVARRLLHALPDQSSSVRDTPTGTAPHHGLPEPVQQHQLLVERTEVPARE